jgi:hypothetical protein
VSENKEKNNLVISLLAQEVYSPPYETCILLFKIYAATIYLIAKAHIVVIQYKVVDGTHVLIVCHFLPANCLM